MWAFQVRSGTPVIEVSIDDVAQAEGNGPAQPSHDLADPVVDQPAGAGRLLHPTGTADGDFIPVAGTVIFAPGQTRRRSPSKGRLAGVLSIPRDSF